jgi:ABC-type lipoprotein release transport system permease subunit
MNNLLTLAWRNVWRKKRRSFIAIVSVAFAVVVSISLRSLMLGNYDKMTEAAVRQTGYLQVHQANYWKDKSINDCMNDSPELRARISSVRGVRGVLGRLQNFALAAGEKTSKASMVIGLQPNEENTFNRLSKRLVQGSFLTAEARGVLLAEGLAKYLKLGIGDTLVLIGQGYHASTAAGKYAVQGIVRLPNPQMNLQMVYMPLRLAQEWNAAENLVSAYLLDIEDYEQTETMQSELRKTLSADYEIMTWDEMMPEVRNSQRIDTTIFTMLSTCLYVIIGFGLIGTMLMMALERTREFAALRAVGMQAGEIQQLIFTEAVILTGLGILVAFCIAVPFVLTMHYNPIPLTGESGKAFEAMGIDNPSLQLGIKPHLFALMSAIVAGIMLVSTLVPMLLVRRMNVSETMK